MGEDESVIIWFYWFFGETYIYTHKPHIAFIDSRPNST